MGGKRWTILLAALLITLPMSLATSNYSNIKNYSTTIGSDTYVTHNVSWSSTHNMTTWWYMWNRTNTMTIQDTFTGLKHNGTYVAEWNGTNGNWSTKHDNMYWHISLEKNYLWFNFTRNTPHNSVLLNLTELKTQANITTTLYLNLTEYHNYGVFMIGYSNNTYSDAMLNQYQADKYACFIGLYIGESASKMRLYQAYNATSGTLPPTGIGYVYNQTYKLVIKKNYHPDGDWVNLTQLLYEADGTLVGQEHYPVSNLTRCDYTYLKLTNYDVAVTNANIGGLLYNVTVEVTSPNPELYFLNRSSDFAIQNTTVIITNNSNNVLTYVWQVGVKDSDDKYNLTGQVSVQEFADSTPPNSSNVNLGVTFLSNGSDIGNPGFQVKWEDDTMLDSALMSWNCTSDHSFKNVSTYIFRAISGTAQFINIKLNSTKDYDTCDAYSYANDTSNNWDVSSNVTIHILKQVPVASVSLNTSTANENTVVGGAVALVSDGDGDSPVSNESRWYNGTTLISGVGNSSNLSAEWSNGNETWTYSGRLWDGYNWSAWHNISIFFVYNDTTPPVNNTGIRTNNTYPKINSSIKMNVTLQDNINLSWAWLGWNCNKGGVWQNISYSQVYTNAFVFNKSFTLNWTANISTCWLSAWVNDTSKNVYALGNTSLVINKSIPTISAVIENKPLDADDSINCTYNNFFDADDDWSVTKELRWYNGTAYLPQYDNVTMLKGTNATSGANWTCGIRVMDAYNWSAWTNTSVTIADAGAPTINEYGRSPTTGTVSVTDYTFCVNVTDPGGGINDCWFTYYNPTATTTTINRTSTVTYVSADQWCDTYRPSETGTLNWTVAACHDNNNNLYINTSVGLTVTVSTAGSPGGGGGGGGAEPVVPVCNLNGVCEAGETNQNCPFDCKVADYLTGNLLDELKDPKNTLTIITILLAIAGLVIFANVKPKKAKQVSKNKLEKLLGGG